jgi:hypothetical protein
VAHLSVARTGSFAPKQRVPCALRFRLNSVQNRNICLSGSETQSPVPSSVAQSQVTVPTETSRLLISCEVYSLPRCALWDNNFSNACYLLSFSLSLSWNLRRPLFYSLLGGHQDLHPYTIQTLTKASLERALLCHVFVHDAHPIVTHLYFKDDVINNVSHFFLSIYWRWCVKDTQEWHHAKGGMASVLPVPNRMPCFSAFSRNVNEWLLDRRNRHVFFIHLFIQLCEHSVPNYDHRAIWIVWTDVVVSASPLPCWSYWSDYEKSSFGKETIWKTRT